MSLESYKWPSVYGDPKFINITRVGPRRRVKLYSWVIFDYDTPGLSFKALKVMAYSLWQARRKIRENYDDYLKHFPELYALSQTEFALDVDDIDTPPQVWH